MKIEYKKHEMMIAATQLAGAAELCEVVDHFDERQLDVLNIIKFNIQSTLHKIEQLVVLAEEGPDSEYLESRYALSQAQEAIDELS